MTLLSDITRINAGTLKAPDRTTVVASAGETDLAIEVHHPEPVYLMSIARSLLGQAKDIMMEEEDDHDEDDAYLLACIEAALIELPEADEEG